MKALIRKLGAIHPDHQRIFKGAFRVAVFLLLGKAAGAVKEMAVAYRYGVSDAVDAYQFTMTMATWLPVTIVGVLSVVLIPVLVRLRRADGVERGDFIRELQGWVLAAGIALALLTWLAWPYALGWLGQGLSSQVRGMTGDLLLAFAPVSALLLVAGISAARLRAHERHVNTLLDSVPAVATLAWVMLAVSAEGVGPLLWGTLVGYAIQTVWLAWLAARADAGFWGWPRFTLRSPHWPELMGAAGVMLIGQVAMSFVGPLDQYAAANLGANANATLGYASRLLSLILGIGAVSVGRAALPVLADVQSRGDGARARAMALKWSLLMVLAGAGAVVLGWLLAPWGVSVLFQRGAFTAENTQAVAQVLRWGLLQLPFYFGVLILVQLLASQNRYRLMSVIAVANFALKAALNAVLAPRMGAAGIMLATSLMYLLSFACYLAVALRPVHTKEAAE
ncbi:polysaccharide biosynthesis C-terminal domain-containing protein [Achromobacter sp. Marseille-Q0513]|uniref:murein biosynthesis integral membrane protein MurJ n=1 Tax=Achromobacter sp. Marseille-Q0513 TaxID=2829161 RepID=UPI001B9EBE26|nr:lipid II flippase MurJ [Achromobacter sp. Marseille-Q0513]MBR8653634.1 polysaccharide biosynthesis C-terminal domain-containing protein [Achromobacter sp. Marseille-Q0513]